jgi:hypothetical protein
MRLLNVNGTLVNKNVRKYLVNWEGKSRSKLQYKFKQFFYPYWKNHIVYEEFPVYGSMLKVDLLNATKKIAVEIQGEQHESFNKFFHDNSRLKYLQSIKRDVKKEKWLEINEFKFLQVYESDLKTLSPQYIEEKCGILII